MPIYEYVCLDCGKKFTVYVLNVVGGQEEAVCPRCGSKNVRKLISRIRYIESEEARLERLAESTDIENLDPNDPKALAKFVKKMGQELGDEFGPEFEEMVDRIESGELDGEISDSGEPSGEGEGSELDSES